MYRNTPIWGTAFWGISEEPVFALARQLSSLRSELYQRIIVLLVQARKDSGITQVELGERLGQRQTFVSKFELCERRLDVAEFIEICRALDIDPYEMMRKAEASKP